METETQIRELIEQLQQLLECAGTCLLLECPDQQLRHPILDLWPLTCTTRLPATPEAGDRFFPPALFLDKQIQAYCDLALQSGSLQNVQHCATWLPHHPRQCLTIAPLERSAGTLGLLLLAYPHPQHVGPGEQQLLAACLPAYSKRLEQCLWKQIHASRWQSKENEQGQTPTNGKEQFVSSDMISMIGHELRAPLSVIKGYVALLQMCGSASASTEPELPPTTQLHYLEVVMEQTGLLELLVNDLLDITRLQQGQLALTLTAVEIAPFCQQIAQLGQLRADQQARGKYQIVCTIAPELPPVLADRDRLRQVLLNIMENAIKYSPHGGCIELHVEPATIPTPSTDTSRPGICLKVRDQGIGIPAAHTLRLFRPFERLERPATESIPGIGLGLYIARQLITAMHGHIEIESVQHQGTTVTILLPVAEAAERHPQSMAQLRDANNNHASMTPFLLRQ